MTQAFNLSQLANGVNTSGQLNAAANLYNQVPVANGGTNASSFTGNAAIISNAGGTALSSVAAGANGNVLTSNGTTWTSAANVAGTSINILFASQTSGTWTKPATVKSIKVTVIGGGGNGGGTDNTGPGVNSQGGGGGGGGTAIRYYPAASLPGPQPFTVGGAASASSFGVAPAVVITASGGVSGTLAPAGAVSTNGGAGGGATAPGGIAFNGGGGGTGNSQIVSCFGGSSFMSGSHATLYVASANPGVAGASGLGYGGGGQGSYKVVGQNGAAGGAGATGIVIIEEFY